MTLRKMQIKQLLMLLLQINILDSKLTSVALVNHAAIEQPKFVLNQEPWVNGGRICGLRTPNYKLYMVNSEGKVRAYNGKEKP